MNKTAIQRHLSTLEDVKSLIQSMERQSESEAETRRLNMLLSGIFSLQLQLEMELDDG